MKPLSGMRALVTSGPTYEPIDPVRFIGNRSSGRQGHAIAAALAAAGAEVVLVSGPVAIADPAGVKVVKVNTAREMLGACEAALPVEIAVCAAAVGDWRVKKTSARKLKKRGGKAPALELVENPDILRRLSRKNKQRPKLVIGFAAETENLLKNARAKREGKGCDWILANDVRDGALFGAEENTVHLITAEGAEGWPAMSKEAVAEGLVGRIIQFIKQG